MEASIFTFKKIYERDIDLLILREFVTNRAFAQLFLSKANLGPEYTVLSAQHSLSDADGESDITLVLQYPQNRIALLIEDKIDAPTMKEQSARYRKRAEAAKQRGEYDCYYIFLTAPAAYHKEHQKDANAEYDYRIEYEELLSFFTRSNETDNAFNAAMIATAIEEKKSGYQVQESAPVTAFWRNLRKYCAEQYPQLLLLGEDAPKGSAASWPEFRTSIRSVRVIYKAPKGIVDLEFPGYGEKTAALQNIVGCKLQPPMQIFATGKSAVVRLFNENWKTDFSQDFNSQQNSIASALCAVNQLCLLANAFDYTDFY